MSSFFQVFIMFISRASNLNFPKNISKKCPKIINQKHIYVLNLSFYSFKNISIHYIYIFLNVCIKYTKKLFYKSTTVSLLEIEKENDSLIETSRFKIKNQINRILVGAVCQTSSWNERPIRAKSRFNGKIKT